MKKIIAIILLFSSLNSFGGNLNAVYKKELQEVKKIEGRGNNKLFTLMRNSAVELSKDWSPELANELAIVFNKLLNVNKNYFLVELLDPVLNSHKAKFKPILDKNLSSENKKLYKRLREMADRELSKGNG